MRHTASRELYDYWNRLRDTRPVPRRDEIEPSDIRHLLSDTFILEVSTSLKTICYRLAGTRICSMFGRELKGYGFLGHWREKDGFEITRLLTRVYREHQPAILAVRAFTETEKHIDLETLLLPLQPMPDGGARIIGISTAQTDAYWTGIEPIVECTMRSCRAIEPGQSNFDASPFGENQITPPSLAPDLEQTSSNGLLGKTSRKIAHLIIHEGGKD